MKTKGALVWDLNQPSTVDEIEIGDVRDMLEDRIFRGRDTMTP